MQNFNFLTFLYGTIKTIMWDEVEKARKDKRRELVLSGKALDERMRASNGVIDPSVFDLTSLNFLDLSSCAGLSAIPAKVGNLVGLTSLIMNNNAIEEIPAVVGKLVGLKVLDLSSNKIESVPSEVAKLPALTTLNLSMNQISALPALEGAMQLARVDVANNKIADLGFICNCASALSLLAEVNASGNAIESIPKEIAELASLKKLDLSKNSLKAVPGELADCVKVKELILSDNPFADNRLKKMVAQKGTKSVMDYVRQNCSKESGTGGKSSKGKKGKKGKKNSVSKDADEEDDMETLADMIDVMHMKGDSPTIEVDLEAVAEVRPYIVCCIVRNLDLSKEGNLKKFIQLQTKLHDTVCEKRNASTIATHDLDKIPAGNIVYTAMEPKSLHIRPLGKKQDFSAEHLVTHLREEAEAYRKEKKRNTISGIHQYLNLLAKKSEYACLKDSSGRIVSFPPITNSDGSKIDENTKNVLVEVTSGTKLQAAKAAADALLTEMLSAGLGEAPSVLVVEQMKLLDASGNTKVVYPSKTDLATDALSGGRQITIRRP